MIVATHLFDYIVCVKTNTSSSLGLIKIHLDIIVKYLYEKFDEIKQIIIDRLNN
jgi:hypothetical protein